MFLLRIKSYLELLVGKISKEEIEFRERRKFVGRNELSEVSKILSRFLPKLEDSSLFEIDHILYPGQKWSDNEESQCVIDPEKLFDKMDIETYLSDFYQELTENDKFNDILCDNTLLKVMKHLPSVTKYYLDLDKIMELLLDSKTEKHVCFGLKLLKICLNGNFKEDYNSSKICSMISRYKGIPTEMIKDNNEKKVVLFIVKLATECYAEFEEKCRFSQNEVPQLNILASKKKLFMEMFYYILHNNEFPNFYLDFLYDTLTSENDLTIRSRYLKCILRAITFYLYPIPIEYGFSKITDCLLEDIDYYKESSRLNKQMRIIDKDFGHTFKPYLSDVSIDSKMLWNDEVKTENEEKTDYVFEKHVLYDELMKKLHLLTIFYNAFKMRNSLCEGEFIEVNDSEAFRECNRLTNYIGIYLNNPDLPVPWSIEKTLQMCPFLIFPYGTMGLVIGLIKYLRGDKISEMSEELSHKIEEFKRMNKYKLY